MENGSAKKIHDDVVVAGDVVEFESVAAHEQAILKRNPVTTHELAQREQEIMDRAMREQYSKEIDDALNAFDAEQDKKEEDIPIDSDEEVDQVMEAMKSWTKTPPFPNDAEYFFPRETRARRMAAQAAFCAGVKLSDALRGEVRVPSLDNMLREATGGITPEDLFLEPRQIIDNWGRRRAMEAAEAAPAAEAGETAAGLQGEGEGEGASKGKGRAAGAVEIVGLENGEWKGCLGCAAAGVVCVFGAGAESCESCLARSEFCIDLRAKKAAEEEGDEAQE